MKILFDVHNTMFFLNAVSCFNIKTRIPPVAGAALWVPSGNQLEPTGWTPHPELQSGPTGPDTLTPVEFVSVTTTEIYTPKISYQNTKNKHTKSQLSEQKYHYHHTEYHNTY